MLERMSDIIKAAGHDADDFNDHVGDLELFRTVDEAMRWMLAWEYYDASGRRGWADDPDWLSWLEREAYSLVGNGQASAETEYALGLLNESLGLDPDDRVPFDRPAFYMPLCDYLRGRRESCGDVVGCGDVLARAECAGLCGPFVELTPDDWYAECAPRGADAWLGAFLNPAVFRNCGTPAACQAVIDDLCRAAGTDADPAYADRGPMVVFSAVRALDLD